MFLPCWRWLDKPRKHVMFSRLCHADRQNTGRLINRVLSDDVTVWIQNVPCRLVGCFACLTSKGWCCLRTWSLAGESMSLGLCLPQVPSSHLSWSEQLPLHMLWLPWYCLTTVQNQDGQGLGTDDSETTSEINLFFFSVLPGIFIRDEQQWMRWRVSFQLDRI